MWRCYYTAAKISVISTSDSMSDAHTVHDILYSTVVTFMWIDWPNGVPYRFIIGYKTVSVHRMYCTIDEHTLDPPQPILHPVSRNIMVMK